MCLVCIDLIKQSLSITEAVKNLTEIVHFSNNNTKHEEELLKALNELDLDKLSELLDG